MALTSYLGGVVRNPQGQVVKHLAEVGRTVKKHNLRGTDLGKNLLIGVVVTAGIAAVATGSYYVGRFFDKRHMAVKSAMKVRERLCNYLVSASRQEFSLDDMRDLARELDKFLKNCDAAGVTPDELFITKEAQRNLNEIYESLVNFNYEVAEKQGLTYDLPPLIEGDATALWRQLSEQLTKQATLVGTATRD